MEGGIGSLVMSHSLLRIFWPRPSQRQVSQSHASALSLSGATTLLKGVNRIRLVGDPAMRDDFLVSSCGVNEIPKIRVACDKQRREHSARRLSGR